MIVLGIDPGLANMGYVVCEVGERITPIEMGLIRTKKSHNKQKILVADDNFRRGREISRALRDIGSRHAVVALCMEAKSFPRNASAAAKTAISIGVLADLVEEGDLAAFMASPQAIKKKVCGNSSASKKDIQAALDRTFGQTLQVLVSTVSKVPPSLWEHPYDALGAIVTCTENESFRLLRKIV